MGQCIHHANNALGRLARGIQQFERRIIGRRFLPPIVGQVIAHGDLLATGDKRNAKVASARQNRAKPQNRANEGRALRIGQRFAAARQMAARDMANLMG